MQETQWAPRTGGIVGCAVAGGVLAVVSVVAVIDTAGRILTGVAALGLIIFAAVSWRARPKLAITASGLLVRGWWRVHLLGRGDITRIRITEFRRIGRKVRLLEIETSDDRLRVLSRWDLGTEPLDVLDALTAAGYGQRSNGMP
jgi:hypothetical protein